LRPPASPVASLGSTIVIRASNQYELQLVFCGSATTCRRHWPPRHTSAWHWLAPTPTPPRRAAATRGAYVARELEPVWCTLSEISALLTVTMPSPSRSSAQVDSAGPARAAPSSAREQPERAREQFSTRAKWPLLGLDRSCPDFRNRPVEFSLYSCGSENSAWRRKSLCAGRNSWLMSRFPVRLPEGFHGQLVCVRLLCGAGDDGDLGSVGPI
jgi:hypothetical protein